MSRVGINAEIPFKSGVGYVWNVVQEGGQIIPFVLHYPGHDPDDA